jgi:3-hydroxybutyrate dehydrogenase
MISGERQTPAIHDPSAPAMPSRNRRFDAKSILVTGASRGIGYSVAQAFAEEGARVGILAESAEVHEAAVELRQATHADIVAIECDITDRERLRSAIAAFGPLDVLVANAGTGDITPIDGPAPAVDEIFERLIRINLIGAYNTVRSALPQLRPGGRIIFTSSVHGQGIAPPGMGAYTASKAGLDALMRSLARELGPRGITVNSVAPGMVATELTLGAVRKLFAAQLDPHAAISEAEMIRQLNAGQAIHNVPVDPTKLALAYLFLASSAGDAITGQTINVDHGLSMR